MILIFSVKFQCHVSKRFLTYNSVIFKDCLFVKYWNQFSRKFLEHLEKSRDICLKTFNEKLNIICHERSRIICHIRSGINCHVRSGINCHERSESIVWKC